MHGLCSYRDWYEHLLFFDGAPENHTSNLRAQCQDAQACSPEEYDGGRAMWWDTDLPKERDSFDTLWTSGRFRMLAHACDRDYMHLDGMQGCVPRLLEESGSRTDFVDMSRVKARPRLNPRGRIMRTFGKDKFIPMVQSRAVPGVTDSQYASSGFMSMQEVGGGRFTPCREVAMCREDTFRVAGEAKARQSVGPDGSVSAWQQSHSISCGMYGRLDSDGGCSLDLASLPFYWALCKGATGRSPAYQALWARVGEDCSPFRERTEMLCSVIDDNFKRSGMTATQLGSIRDALNHLADALGYQGAVRSQESYLARASCSQSLHDLWQLDPYGVRGLYGQPKVYSFHVFFSHTTLEVPIAFWFKCIVLEGRTIHTQGFGDRSVVDCEGWTGSRSLAQVEMQGSSAFEIDPLGALKSVDGIVTRSHLQQGLHEMGVRVAHKLYRHGTDYSRKGASNGHSMLCHHRPRFKPKEQTTRECMASIVKWAQRHSSFDHQLFIEANGRTEFPGGVARSCYEFAEPMVHDGATGRKEINLKYAYRKLKIDGQVRSLPPPLPAPRAAAIPRGSHTACAGVLPAALRGVAHLLQHHLPAGRIAPPSGLCLPRGGGVAQRRPLCGV